MLELGCRERAHIHLQESGRRRHAILSRRRLPSFAGRVGGVSGGQPLLTGGTLHNVARRVNDKMYRDEIKKTITRLRDRSLCICGGCKIRHELEYLHAQVENIAPRLSRRFRSI